MPDMTAKEKDREVADRIADADRMIQTTFHYNLIHGWARTLRLAELALHHGRGEDANIARIEQVCKEAELHYYIDPYPYGCKLYVSHRIIHMRNYGDVGVPCSIGRKPRPKPVDDGRPKNKCQGEQVCKKVPLRVFSIKHEVGATHITFCEKCYQDGKNLRSGHPVWRRAGGGKKSGWREQPAPTWKQLPKIESFA